MEIWKDIKGYEGLYQVSNMGRVKSLKYGKERLLKTTTNKNRYIGVTLCNGKSKHHNIHRLVAETFIPNPINKPCIDHINTNKTDNRVENLRWVTHKENSNNKITLNKIQHILNKRNTTQLISVNSKSVLQFTIYGELVDKWDSLMDIQRTMGYSSGQICDVCNGKNKTAKGYKWGYADDYERIPFKVFDLEIYRKKVV